MSEEVTVTEVGNLSFKEGLEELAAIVRSLESNQIELEQSIESYERGVALATPNGSCTRVAPCLIAQLRMSRLRHHAYTASS